MSAKNKISLVTLFLVLFLNVSWPSDTNSATHYIYDANAENSENFYSSQIACFSESGYLLTFGYDDGNDTDVILADFYNDGNSLPQSWWDVTGQREGAIHVFEIEHFKVDDELASLFYTTESFFYDFAHQVVNDANSLRVFMPTNTGKSISNLYLNQ